MSRFNENTIVFVGSQDEIDRIMWQMVYNGVTATNAQLPFPGTVPHDPDVIGVALRDFFRSHTLECLSPDTDLWSTTDDPSILAADAGDGLVALSTSFCTGRRFASDVLSDFVRSLPAMRIGVGEIHRFEGDECAYAHLMNINTDDGCVLCGPVDDMGDSDASYYADDEGMGLGELMELADEWPPEGIPAGGKAEVAGRIALECFLNYFLM